MRTTGISSVAATTTGTAVRMRPILFAAATAAATMARMLLVLFAATATATAATAALGGLVFVVALP